MSEITITPVTPDQVAFQWALVQPLLERCMPVNLRRFEPIDILRLLGNLTQAWFIKEDETLLAVMVTQVIQYPRRRCCSMFALAGTRMSEWFSDADAALTDYARKMGCDHFETQGRPGWQKILDLEPRAVVLVKDISPANGGANE